MTKYHSIESFNNLPFNTKLDWFINLSAILEVDGHYTEVCITDNQYPIFFEEDSLFSYFGHTKFNIKYGWIKNILITDPYTISIYLVDNRVERINLRSGIECPFTGDESFGNWLVKQIQSCTEDEYIMIDGTPAFYNKERNVICLTTGEELNPTELRQNPTEEYEIIGPDGLIQCFYKQKKELIPTGTSQV